MKISKTTLFWAAVIIGVQAFLFFTKPSDSELYDFVEHSSKESAETLTTSRLAAAIATKAIVNSTEIHDYVFWKTATVGEKRVAVGIVGNCF